MVEKKKQVVKLAKRRKEMNREKWRGMERNGEKEIEGDMDRNGAKESHGEKRREMEIKVEPDLEVS